MRMTFGLALTLLCLGLTGSAADAYCGPPICCPPIGYWACQPQVVTAYRAEWKEEKVPCVVHRVSYRQETDKVKVQVCVPKLFDQTVRTSYYVPIPKVVERDVTTCVMVPVVMYDPCTCCCYVSYRPSLSTTKVKCTVYDHKLESRDDVVKVCKLVTEERVIDQVRFVPVVSEEKSFTTRRYCVMVPYQTTVNVPVWVPCCP